MDFDKHSRSYLQETQDSINFLPVEHSFFISVKAEELSNIISLHLGADSDPKILDVGCGVGATDKFLSEKFRNLTGVDSSAQSLEEAEKQNPTVKYLLTDGKTLPFVENTFDVSFAICVLHHVAVDYWANFLRDMKRVTRPAGLVIVFEHNPFNPLTRLAVYRCPFDEDANLLTMKKTLSLFSDNDIKVLEKRYILIAPWQNGFVRKATRFLENIPLGAQFLVVGKKL